jgi:hypothetical protein
MRQLLIVSLCDDIWIVLAHTDSSRSRATSAAAKQFEHAAQQKARTSNSSSSGRNKHYYDWIVDRLENKSRVADVMSGRSGDSSSKTYSNSNSNCGSSAQDMHGSATTEVSTDAFAITSQITH